MTVKNEHWRHMRHLRRCERRKRKAGRRGNRSSSGAHYSSARADRTEMGWLAANMLHLIGMLKVHKRSPGQEYARQKRPGRHR